MMTIDFAGDIPVELARAAHSGTSHDPERRAEQEREGYAATLTGDYASLAKHATTPEKQATLVEEFVRYREGYGERYREYLQARSRCMSTMITGGSNFPVRRQRKINDVADKRMVDLVEFRKRALAAIYKELTPELQPIMSGDSDAVARIRTKLAECVALQARMVAANKAIRSHQKAGPEAQIAALVALGISGGAAQQLLKPDDLKRIGFPDFSLKNNGAEIRRLEKRLAEVGAKQAQELTIVEGTRGKVEFDPQANRVRIFFAEKRVAPEVYKRLKANGFRWAPTQECFSAYHNPKTIACANSEAGIEVAS